jgi:hypothetical protein
VSKPISIPRKNGDYDPKKKMVTMSFKNENFVQPMGRPSMQLGWTLFFPFWGVVGRVIFNFSSLFPMCFLYYLIMPHLNSSSSQLGP